MGCERHTYSGVRNLVKPWWYACNKAASFAENLDEVPTAAGRTGAHGYDDSGRNVQPLIWIWVWFFTSISLRWIKIKLMYTRIVPVQSDNAALSQGRVD